MVGHVMLFSGAIAKMKEMIDRGDIGKLEYIYSNRLNLGTVRKEENILWSFAPHDISIFQYFVGKPPLKVVSHGGAYIQPHIHDTTMTTLHYPDNINGHIFVSWLHPFKEHRIVVIGSKGMLSFEDSGEKRILFYEKGIDFVQGEPVKRDGDIQTVDYDKTQPLEAELRYFLEHLDGTIELNSPKDALTVMSVLESATKSLLSGEQSVVTTPALPEKKALFYVHPTAFVDEPTDIGEGTKIWHYSHVQSGCKIGKNVVMGQNVNIGTIHNRQFCQDSE